MAGKLDTYGILTLYKAQIRPCMEYSALTWMSSAATHVQRLDAVQRRALRLVDRDEHQQPAHVTELEHQCDVSAPVVFHKAQMQELSPRGGPDLTSDELVAVPRSHSRHV